MRFMLGRFCLGKNEINFWTCAMPSVTYWILLGMYYSAWKNSSWYKRDTKRLLGE